MDSHFLKSTVERGDVSTKSTPELVKRWLKMRTYSKPTHDQLMMYLRIYSELEYRNAVPDVDE